MIILLRRDHPQIKELRRGLYQIEDEAYARTIIASMLPHAEEVGPRDMEVREDEYGPPQLHGKVRL